MDNKKMGWNESYEIERKNATEGRKKENAMSERENVCYGSYSVSCNARAPENEKERRERARERKRESYGKKTRTKEIIKKYIIY